MILCMITIYPSPGEESRIIDVLDSIRGAMAANTDCHGCLFATEAGKSGAICYMERWRTREALDRHLRSALYCQLLEAIELSRIPPEVEFFEISTIGGLDVVEKARL
jgi:quinol monooxygenase YgiN